MEFMEYVDVWDLKKGDEVMTPDGSKLTFRKMDGMYAQWTQEDGEMAIGNFSKILKVGDKYIAN